MDSDEIRTYIVRASSREASTGLNVSITISWVVFLKLDYTEHNVLGRNYSRPMIWNELKYAVAAKHTTL